MRKLFLHIGMPKSGTTTIQYVLAENRKLLLDEGVLVPQAGVGAALHQQGHHELSAELKRNEHRVIDDLLIEIEKSKASAVVVSSEELSSLNQRQIEVLGHAFSAYDVKVIVYLREQASFVESLYNQAVKTGAEKRDRHEFLADILSSNRLNYLSIVKAWSGVFGKENIKPKRYDNSFVDGKALLDDFFGCVGVNTDKLNIARVSYNESVDSRYIEFLRVVNRVGFESDVKNAKIVSVLLGPSSYSNGVRTSIFGVTERKLVRNYCKASNRALAKEYFGNSGDLFKVDDKEVNVVPDAITPELLAEIMSRLVVSVVP